MLANLQDIIQRVVTGNHDEADIQTILAAIASGEIVLTSTSGSVDISGDAADALILTGSKNVVGDRNIVIYGADAQAIHEVLAQHSSLDQITAVLSINELVQQARSHASSKVLNSFSKVRLLNKRQVVADLLYVDVYLLKTQEFHATIPGLLEGQDVRGQFDRLGLGQRGERSQGLELAASSSYPRLMVLGKPGSGKSTFLRHLAVGCAKGEFLDDYISVLLELRDVENADFSLFQCIHMELGLQQESQTARVLKQGRVLILLDGLDEVSHSLRQKVQSELRKFVKGYDKNRFILTCRTQTTEYIPEQFEVLEVADFTPEQVECFALNWFAAMAENLEQGAAVKDHFMEKLRENPQTAELAVTPVLLSLTCWIFDGLRCLPEKRSDLYERGLDLLLQQWDEGRGIHRNSGSDRYQQITVEERKQLLSYLAVRKFEQAENFVLFEEVEICGYIAGHLQISVGESREVLGAIAEQHGLLIERAQGIWSFSHLTFQEYLVARWFCNQEVQCRLGTHIFRNYYREVFLLAFEMLTTADRLASSMKVEIDSLISEEHKLQDYIQWIELKTKKITISNKPSAIRAFYLKPALAPIHNLNLANAIDSEFSQKILPVFERDIICVFTKNDHRIILVFDYANHSFHCFDTPLNPSLENDLRIMEDEVKNLYFSMPTLENIQQLLEARSSWIEQMKSLVTRNLNSGFNWTFDVSAQ
jgi:hypothetical protein